MKKPTLWLMVACGMLIASGVVHGIWTHRWTASREIEQAVERLKQVPIKLGDWQGEESDLSNREKIVAGGTGYLLRTYTHRLSGTKITMLLMCGRPGPLAAHTPEVCYGGTGFRQMGEASGTTVKIGSQQRPAKFFWANFRKDQIGGANVLRNFWAWGADGRWSVSANPRFAFAGNTVLYKVYLIRLIPRENDPVKVDPCLDLARELLPVLQKSLFATG